jgi:hypothetical protein
MKKLVVGMLLSVCLLAACGKETEVDNKQEATKAPTATVAPEATKEPEATTAPAATIVPEITEAPKAEAVVPVRLLMEHKEMNEWENGRQLYAVIWENPLIGGEDAEKYPAVSTVLRSLRTLQDEAAGNMATELLKTAEDLKQYADEMTVSCYDSKRYYVQRADNRIISMRFDRESNTGAAHPMRKVTGFNISTETGDLLSLSDVVTDAGQIKEMVKKELSEQYIDYFFEEWEALFDEMKEEDLAWTLDYDGLTFYFSPYALSVYAAGVLTVDIDFADEPALFRRTYMTAPEQGSVSEVTFYSPMELTGTNGVKDVLVVGQFREEGDDYHLKLEIEKNGKNILAYDVYAYEYKAYVVTVAEKNYLFVEATADNDYDVLYVFDLSQDRITEPLEQMNAGFATVPIPTNMTAYSFVEEIFNNPAEIRLSSRLDIFRTMSGTRCYTFDADAMTLVPQTDFYLLDETQTPLVAKLPVEVTMLSDQTKETVPAGTEFTFLRSDGRTYAEFRLPDGRECRVTREDGFGCPYTVNGVPEEDVFEGIIYSG